MSQPISTLGDLNANNLNQYLGADPAKQLRYSGAYGAPNFSLNQIFFSNANSGNPPQPASNTFRIDSLLGKTFGIYKNTYRTEIYGNSYSNTEEFGEQDLVPLIPVFLGYFGFGSSGILNPYNTGFPLRITIESLDWATLAVAVKTGSGLNYETINLSGTTTTFISTTADAIRIIGGLRRVQNTVVNLTVAPCLRGTGNGGTGFHKIIITLSSGDDIRPPIDPPPIDVPPGGGGLIDDGGIGGEIEGNIR